MRRRRLQWALLVLGAGFITVTLVRNWDQLRDGVEVSPGSMIGATAACGLGLTLLGVGWAMVHPEGSRAASLTRRFLLAQPGKYVPGGIAMPVGQVVLSKGADESTGAAVARLVLHSGMMVAAGLVVAGGLVTGTSVRLLGWLSLALGLSVTVWLVVSDVSRATDSMGRALGRVLHRRLPKLPAIEIGPSRKLVAMLAVTAGISAIAMAFPILYRSSDEGVLAMAGAFALAWTVGFIAVPVPAGAGIREAVLLLALTGATPGQAIAVALLHRLAMLVAEVIGFSLAGAVEGIQSRGGGRPLQS